jgi:hypothetical protein
MFSRMHKVAHSEEENWVTRADVMTTGIPNLLTHPCNKAFALSTAVVAGNRYSFRSLRSSVHDSEQVEETLMLEGGLPGPCGCA